MKILIPDFSENTDDGMMLYFKVEKGSEKSIMDSLEMTYIDFVSMKPVNRPDGYYICLVMPNGEI